MILSKTPYRVSFFGGGTDYPAWYEREGGAVLSTSIDKYCYISCRVLPPFFEARHRVVWSHIELVDSIGEILHPAIRAGMRFLGFDDSVGLEIHHQGDLPARAGIGSSAAFAVGLIKALLALRGESIDRHDLALKAIELEQKVLSEHVGSQDQLASAYGGFNLIEFQPDGHISVQPVKADRERLALLESSLLLIYTGTSRLASEVAQSFVAGLESRASELRAMRRMVDDALSIINGSGDLDELGRLLHEAWGLKRSLSPIVSNEVIDGIYKRALEHGAVGGKLLGAGSSGFMIFYVPEERRAELERALGAYVQVPFRFEDRGSHLLRDEPSL
ncbi:MAG: kinase [Myxococcota bacterium]